MFIWSSKQSENVIDHILLSYGFAKHKYGKILTRFIIQSSMFYYLGIYIFGFKKKCQELCLLAVHKDFQSKTLCLKFPGAPSAAPSTANLLDSINILSERRSISPIETILNSKPSNKSAFAL